MLLGHKSGSDPPLAGSRVRVSDIERPETSDTPRYVTDDTTQYRPSAAQNLFINPENSTFVNLVSTAYFI